MRDTMGKRHHASGFLCLTVLAFAVVLKRLHCCCGVASRTSVRSQECEEAELCAAWRANSHDYGGLLGVGFQFHSLRQDLARRELHHWITAIAVSCDAREAGPRAMQNFATHPSSRQARFCRADVDGVYEWSLPTAVAAHIQVGHFALSRSAMAAMRASATIPAWSKAVNLPARRRMRPSTITVSTFVGRPSETIAS
jgi:hypothetical protein